VGNSRRLSSWEFQAVRRNHRRDSWCHAGCRHDSANEFGTSHGECQRGIFCREEQETSALGLPATGELHKIVKFAGGTAKNEKIAKRQESCPMRSARALSPTQRVARLSFVALSNLGVLGGSILNLSAVSSTRSCTCYS